MLFCSSWNQLNYKLLGQASVHESKLKTACLSDKVKIHIVQFAKDKIIVEQGMESPFLDDLERNIRK